MKELVNIPTYLREVFIPPGYILVILPHGGRTILIEGEDEHLEAALQQSQGV